MSDDRLGRAMLGMAKKGWQALREMADNPAIADEIFGFHAQQAVEKSLKAWLALRGVDAPRTHNLILLFDGLDECGVDVEPFWDLVSLNTFAVQFRYEAMEPDAERLDREATLQQVPALVECVEKIFSKASE